jgi:hypothetical protein
VVKICDFCSGRSIGVTHPIDLTPAVVDGPTKMGPWANMCLRHLISAGTPSLKLNYWLEAPHHRTEEDVIKLVQQFELEQTWSEVYYG